MASLAKRVTVSIVAGLLIGAAIFVLALSAFLNSSLELGYLISLLQSFDDESAQVYLAIVGSLLAYMAWELVRRLALQADSQRAN